MITSVLGEGRDEIDRSVATTDSGRRTTTLASTNHDFFIQSPFFCGRGFRSLVDFPFPVFFPSCCNSRFPSLFFRPLLFSFFLSFPFLSARAAAVCSSGQGEGRRATAVKGRRRRSRESSLPSRKTCSGGSGRRATTYSTAIVQKGGGADGGASFFLSSSLWWERGGTTGDSFSFAGKRGFSLRG